MTMIKLSILLFSLFQSSIALYAQEQELIIKTNEVDIGGSLFLPEADPKNPLIILISGSGAQDRDESILGFKPFQKIAEHLSENGIPSFRFDDRGVGKSTGVFNKATLDILVSDVEAIIQYFKQESDVKFDEFILLGHSQGGMVAAKAASQNKAIVKVILMASPTVPLKNVISEQIVVMQKAVGKTDEDLVQTLAFQDKVYEAVRTDTGWDELEVDFKELIKAEIAKLPEAQQAYITDIDAFSKAQFERSVNPIKTPQMRSLMFYDAGEDLSKLNIPILGLFGEKDTQVTEEQNASRFNEICEDREEYCVTVVFENANHLFQKADTGLPMEYATLAKEFVDGFLESISKWVLKK